MKILFVDCVAYKPYTYVTPTKEGLGGSESTVVRIAHGLAQRNHQVFLFNRIDTARTQIDYIYGIGHLGAETPYPTPDVVIHIRFGTQVAYWKECYPSARHIVWYHDFAGSWLTKEESDLEGICVSHWHKMNLEKYISTVPDFIKRPIYVIYNAVVTYPVLNKKIAGRLGYFSSPHKGLQRCYELYARAKKERPYLSFAYSNPGYFADEYLPAEAINMGQMIHSQVSEELSKCEVLFYPAATYPETFGIVMAEANAVGTPVLACDLGAARELLGNGNTILATDSTDEQIIAALFEMLDRKPLVMADARFSINSVLDQWEHLLLS